MMSKLMTIREAAEHLKIDVRLLYRETKTGKLPYYIIGRAIRIDLADLESFKVGGTDGKYSKEKQ
jgi:excisionase family DNA binding protein